MNVFKKRREDLIQLIRQEFNILEGCSKDFKILLFASFENARSNFIQDASFYYYTGVTEPGVACVFDFDNNFTLFKPNFCIDRTDWVLVDNNYQKLDINKVEYLGNSIDGYSITPYFSYNDYNNLINNLHNCSQKIFTINFKSKNYWLQSYIIDRLIKFNASLESKILDISNIIARMRQVKDKGEIEEISKAIHITLMAQDAIKGIIKPGIKESEIHACIESTFIANGASVAFPSIVASGFNSTVLHYTQNNCILGKDQTLVVDIGAMYNNYCADITRTYSTSGEFTKEQEFIYNLVLKTQQHIASIAKPGMWLNNRNEPNKSLNHLAREYLKSKGYDKYFMHGIGHYLGLEVHDVGDYSQPLKIGEVFTIEPGIYIREKEIGVRIEDDYVVEPNGVRSLGAS